MVMIQVYRGLKLLTGVRIKNDTRPCGRMDLLQNNDSDMSTNSMCILKDGSFCEYFYKY